MTYRQKLPLLASIAASALLIALAASGCNRASETAKVPAAPTPAVLPAGLIVAAPGDGAREIMDVRKDAKDGEEVTLHGRIGGKESPFTAEAATVTLTDSSLKFCSEAGHMKGCPTPWDMCCDDPDEVAGKSVMVRVIGTDGQALNGTLNGAGGMKPMSELVVSGIVRRTSPGTAVFIDAKEIFVKG